ncbi:MAG: hypothetical protein M1608_04205 [Candidatus Omnitrophica bacterium]|nr:hypothetical protein [Candidatus Omnitrophota bacterium]
MKPRKIWIGLAVFEAAVLGARAQTVVFDFDSGAPALATGQNAPLDQASDGITAHFGVPGGSGNFSVQTDASTGYRFSQFTGHYLVPNGLGPNILDIQFSRQLTAVSLTFATADFQQVETPTTVQLTAYENSTGTSPVDAASAHGIYPAETAYPGDTMPQGTLSLNTTNKPFNLVEIRIPYQPLGASVFLVDNITVTAPPQLAVFLTNNHSIVVSWPAASTGFVLQRNEALGSTNWVQLTNAASVVEGRNQVLEPSMPGNRFYRLFHP